MRGELQTADKTSFIIMIAQWVFASPNNQQHVFARESEKIRQRVECLSNELVAELILDQ